jgi:large subunit ribosomal protein L4
MIEIPVHNQKGEQIDTLQVDEAILGGQVRAVLLKQAYVRIHANRRQGSAATRNRSRVEGSTRKLYRQKGTGNARRGAIRTNIMRGGGVAFGKRPRSWRQEMPHRMRKLANRNALLAKAIDGELKVVDQFAVDKPSTGGFAKLLKALSIDRTCLLALSDIHTPTARAARKLADLSIIPVDNLNVFDLLNHRYVLVEKAALSAWLEKAGAQAQAGGRRARKQEAA